MKATRLENRLAEAQGLPTPGGSEPAASGGHGGGVVRRAGADNQPAA